MSKYIPDNQIHFTLDDRIYIKNELNKGVPFKNIARFLCRDPTTISKEAKTHRLSAWYHRWTFIMPKTSASIVITVKKSNACGKITLCGINTLPCSL